LKRRHLQIGVNLKGGEKPCGGGAGKKKEGRGENRWETMGCKIQKGELLAFMRRRSTLIKDILF